MEYLTEEQYDAVAERLRITTSLFFSRAYKPLWSCVA